MVVAVVVDSIVVAVDVDHSRIALQSMDLLECIRVNGQWPQELVEVWANG